LLTPTAPTRSSPLSLHDALPIYLAIRGVTVDFERPGGRLEVLEGIDLEVQPGEVVALIGPNGSGKSTLLRVAAGLLAPRDGSIEDRKSTRLNSSHQIISYAVFCL